MNERLKRLALITEQLISNIPDIPSRDKIVNWLNESPYSPYVTLYGGEGSLTYKGDASFYSEVDGMNRYSLKDNLSFKLENFVNHDDSIYSANTRLYNVINTQELFKAYPEFKDIDISINISNSSNGNYTGSTHHADGVAQRIEVYADNNTNAMRVLLHELQHCIQLKEGFAIGESYYSEHGVMDLFVGASLDKTGNWEEGSFGDTSICKNILEINDNNFKPKYKDNRADSLKIAIEKFAASNDKTPTLDDLFEYEELFSRYPKFKNIPIVYLPNLGAKGSFDGERIEIGSLAETNSYEAMSTILHEIQHAIQREENWARGGNTKDIKDLLYELIDKESPYADYYDNVLTNISNYEIAASLKDEISRLKTNPNSIKKSMLWYQYKPMSVPKGKKELSELCEELSQKAVWGLEHEISELVNESHESSSKLKERAKLFKQDLKGLSKNKESFEKVQKLQTLVKDKTSHELYRRLWGEQQARAVQYRMNMSDEERQGESWTETLEKVEGNYENPIIKYEDGISYCIEKEDREANFKEWFGGSKVIDSEGEPLVVYHGTNENFNKFDINKARSGWLSKGFYFTKEISEAEDYGDNIIKSYISLRNPFIIKPDKIREDGMVDFAPSPKEQIINELNLTTLNMKDARNFLENIGYDGIINGEHIVAFNPTQIKSIHNKGTFDPNNPNILEKNDYGLRQIEKVLSILPNDLNTSTIKDYLSFNGITHEHLRGSIYQDCLDNETFINPVEIDKASIDTNSSYYQNYGEIESREIENKYINMSDEDIQSQFLKDNPELENNFDENLALIEKEARKEEMNSSSTIKL